MKLKYILLIFTVLSMGVSAQANQWKAVNRIMSWTDDDWDKNLKSSLDSLEWAREVSNKNRWSKKEALLYGKLAKFMLRKLNNFERASFYVGEIKKIALRNNNSPEILSIYHNNLGILYYHEGVDRKRAFKEFNKSIEIAKENKFKPGYSTTNNYALALMSEQKYDSALIMLNESLMSYDLESNQKKALNFYSLNYTNRGVCFIYKGISDSASFYFNKALEYSQKSNRKDDLFKAYVYLGVFNQESNNIDIAIDYLTKAKDLLFVPLNFSYKTLLFESLAECYIQKKDFKKAHESRLKQIVYSDSLKQQGYLQQAFSLDYRFELDSITYQKNVNELTSKMDKQNFQFKIVLSISIFTLCLIIALFIIYRLNKQRQLNKIKAENELLEKEKIRQAAELAIFKKEEELIQANVEISIHKNELLSLKNKLESHLEKSYDPEFDDLKHFLKQIKHSEKKLDQLKYLDQVLNSSNNAFYQRIKEKFPNLTDDEMRLATLIRLNLSSDELTLVFNISSSSLMTKRYRLRKKLLLEKEASLEEFIMNL
jgi:tetratricopeptide (TPR) repeat protein